MVGANNTQFVIFHSPGPAWRDGVGFRDQAGIAGHVAHYRAAMEKGRLSLGGPFQDDSGGMMITAPGLESSEVEELAASDPAITSGLLQYDIKAWLAVFRH